MFGIANQLLAVIALCLVTTLLVNTGRGRYAWVTLLPMLFVTTTTMTAGVQIGRRLIPGHVRGGPDGEGCVLYRPDRVRHGQCDDVTLAGGSRRAAGEASSAGARAGARREDMTT